MALSQQTSPAQLRCFVAMAFGRGETDRVYERLIAPTLRRLNVTPVRVDRIEHLEDINNKIIAELKRSDIAVADLTFARPSVYFEAGFAQRSVPVIYTCRKDHFSPREDDTHGNFRVHFDLQMKNIIPWSTSSDRTFVRRFTKRVNHAIKPLIRVREAQQQQNLMAQEFASFSLDQKIQKILDICASRLECAKYQGMETNHRDVHYYFYGFSGVQDFLCDRIVARIDDLAPGWIGRRTQKGRIRAVYVHITPSLTGRELLDLVQNILPGPLYDTSPTETTGRLRRLDEHIVICSFQKVPLSRVQRVLPSFRFDHETDELITDAKQTVSKWRIRNFSGVFSPVDLAFGDEFLALNPAKNMQRLRRERGFILQKSRNHGAPDKRVGRTAVIPRRIHLRIFDHIPFEAAFVRTIEEWLKGVNAR